MLLEKSGSTLLVLVGLSAVIKILVDLEVFKFSTDNIVSFSWCLMKVKCYYT